MQTIPIQEAPVRCRLCGGAGGVHAGGETGKTCLIKLQVILELMSSEF